MFGWHDSLRFWLDGERYILTGRAHRLDEAGVELHPREAYGILHRILGPSAAGGLSRESSALARVMEGPSTADDDTLPGDLVLYRVPRWSHGCSLKRVVDPEHDIVDLRDLSAGPAPAVVEDEWVDVVVVDQDDRPVPLLDYEIRLSDGRVRQGRTNEHGRLYYDELPPGDCELVLLGVDGDLWELV